MTVDIQLPTRVQPCMGLCPLTVVLDMDETLMHTITSPVGTRSGIPADTILLRPHVHMFLARVCARYEVVLFTAGTEPYATTVMLVLDPSHQIKHRRFRQHTDEVLQGIHVKHVDLLGRDIRRVVLIDNSPFSFLGNPENGIPILSYRGDTNDTELLRVQTILTELEHVEDVRPVLTELYNLRTILSTGNPLDLKEF